MRNFLARLLYPTHFRRFLFFFLFDILIITVSLYLSFLLRFDFTLNKEYRDLIFEALPFFIIIKLIIFAGFRMYKITWKYVGINDLCNIVNALIVTNSILMVLILFPLIKQRQSLLQYLFQCRERRWCFSLGILNQGRFCRLVQIYAYTLM